MKFRLHGTGAREVAGKCLTPVAFSLAPFVVCLVFLPACGSSARLSEIEEMGIAAELRLPEDLPDMVSGTVPGTSGSVGMISASDAGESVVMNAVVDEVTGESVAVDRLDAAVVQARFRHVAERNGMIRLEFRICVPESVMDARWQLRLCPVLSLAGSKRFLDDIVITGEEFMKFQLHGYERYRNFISRIITDSLDFIDMHSLETFIARNMPELYAFRDDSCLVSDQEFKSAFGVTAGEAAEHYSRKALLRRNSRLESLKKDRLKKYVQVPFTNDGVRLDTVLIEGSGDFIYDYIQNIPAVPSLRKLEMWLSGEIYGRDGVLCIMPDSDTMTFYVSSISSLCDTLSIPGVMNRDSYMEGLRLLGECRYSDALELLLPYRDYNTAVALVALGRDGYARELLEECAPTARSNYLLAIVSARAGQEKDAVEYLSAACRQDPALRHRARLDPEVAGLVDKYEIEEFVQNL